MSERCRAARRRAPETSPSLLRPAVVRRLLRRTVASGTITIPAVPALLDQYVEMCAQIFAALGRPFDEGERDHARQVIKSKLNEAFAASPRSNLVITYQAPVGRVLRYEVTTEVSTVAAAYRSWLETRSPPLFGTYPDARVMAVAELFGDPASSPVLDLGAGTGRNALALARRGHPVDAVEMTPEFARMLAAEAEQQRLPIRVLESDLFDAPARLGRDYRLLVLSEVVSDFRGLDQLRHLFELAAELLAPQGMLVFNVHMPIRGYTPDQAVRQWAEQCYATIFTEDELRQAVQGLPLELVADDPVYEYEQAHLPPAAWPPTGWYAEWVSGQDLYDLERERCPVRMRWLLYQKKP